MNSETTGPVSLGSVVARQIGTAPSEMRFAGPTVPSAVLATLQPADTDRRVAAALQDISGRRPVFRTRRLFPENGPAYSITEAASWSCDDADQQRRGVDAVAFSLRPAPGAEIAKALYELRTLTRGRTTRSADEDEAEALIWTERLKAYPADIVMAALRDWTKRSDGQWWPTWHDIERLVEPAAAARRLLLTCIETGACLPKPQSGEADERDNSPEGLARRQAQADAARQRFGIRKSQGEQVIDRDAVPAATLAKLDAEAAAVAARIKREGLPPLSAEALSTTAHLAAPSPDEQFEAWDKREGAAA